MATILYANQPETILRAKPQLNGKARNHVLLGTLLEVDPNIDGGEEFLFVNTRRAGKGGFVAKKEVTKALPLKIFFVDVGQGDGTLIETPQGVVVVDGGPSKNFYRFLLHRYKPLFKRGQRVPIRAMIISHPDLDHYKGLQKLLSDKERFSVDTVYHNGIMRYPKKIEQSRKRMLEHNFLKTIIVDGQEAFLLQNNFSTLGQAKSRRSEMAPMFRSFWDAVAKAHGRGDLKKVKRLEVGSKVEGFDENDEQKLRIEVLGPVTHPGAGTRFLALEEPPERAKHKKAPAQQFGYSHSHTRNGHSIVLRLQFGAHSILLGGDLNIPAEKLLLEHHGDNNAFRVDVAKACHHGSSDFSTVFLKRVTPQATVVSSGDNKSFDHPMADAMGAVARHSQGDQPLVFSTELGRSIQFDKKTRKVKHVHYGLVNLRSNGSVLTMAQMKEQHNKADVWDSFTVPWKGKFHV